MWRAEADFCTRQREAFAQFGLDPLAEPAEEAARTVAASRLRDPLLGLLLEWQLHAADPGTKNRLGQVVGAARRLSGGAYARWQDLLDRKDVTGLVAFATSPDGLAFPAKSRRCPRPRPVRRAAVPGLSDVSSRRHRPLPSRSLATFRPVRTSAARSSRQNPTRPCGTWRRHAC